MQYFDGNFIYKTKRHETIIKIKSNLIFTIRIGAICS